MFLKGLEVACTAGSELAQLNSFSTPLDFSGVRPLLRDSELWQYFQA